MSDLVSGTPDFRIHQKFVCETQFMHVKGRIKLSDDPWEDIKKSVKRENYYLHSIENFVRNIWPPRWREKHISHNIGKLIKEDRFKNVHITTYFWEEQGGVGLVLDGPFFPNTLNTETSQTRRSSPLCLIKPLKNPHPCKSLNNLCLSGVIQTDSFFWWLWVMATSDSCQWQQQLMARNYECSWLQHIYKYHLLFQTGSPKALGCSAGKLPHSQHIQRTSMSPIEVLKVVQLKAWYFPKIV